MNDEIVEEMIKAFNLGFAAGRAEGAQRIEELLDEIREIRSNNIDSHSSGHQFD